MSIPRLTTIDQPRYQSKVPSTKRRSHIKLPIAVLPFYATHEKAPTLYDVQQASAGVIARLLVAKVRQGVQHG